MKKGKRSRFGPLASSAMPIDTAARNVIRPAKTYYANEPAKGHFLCVTCGREFQSRVLFEQHRSEAHKGVERALNRQQHTSDCAKRLKCRLCGNEVLDAPKPLRRHLLRKHAIQLEAGQSTAPHFSSE